MSERTYAARNRSSWSRSQYLVWLLLAAVILGTPVTQAARAQDRTASEEGETAAPQPQRPRGRLPTYFARVVTAQQREKIYDLQSQYQEQLDTLLAQVRKLEQQRDMEVFDVLTPEQQQQVTAWTEEARQRRAGGRTTNSTRNESPRE